MKLNFTKINSLKDTIEVSFDKGLTWNTYNKADALSNGIPFTEDDCSDISAICIRGDVKKISDIGVNYTITETSSNDSSSTDNSTSGNGFPIENINVIPIDELYLNDFDEVGMIIKNGNSLQLLKQTNTKYFRYTYTDNAANPMGVGYDIISIKPLSKLVEGDTLYYGETSYVDSSVDNEDESSLPWPTVNLVNEYVDDDWLYTATKILPFAGSITFVSYKDNVLNIHIRNDDADTDKDYKLSNVQYFDDGYLPFKWKEIYTPNFRHISDGENSFIFWDNNITKINVTGLYNTTKDELISTTGGNSETGYVSFDNTDNNVAESGDTIRITYDGFNNYTYDTESNTYDIIIE